MGRKSKKKGKSARRSNAARSQPSAPDKDKGAPPPGDPPPGASCWICLDEEPDDAGRPIVRDCSCRGTSAGFAHLSCLIQYAEQKCGCGDRYADDAMWIKPFMMCPNCNQRYRCQLAINMTTACVDFVEEKQPDCLFRRMGALQHKLGALVINTQYTVEKVNECEVLGKECLSIIEEAKSNPRMSSLLPYVREVETDVLTVLGNLHVDGKDESSGRRAVEYYEKVKELSAVFGRAAVASVDVRIADAKALYEGKKEGGLNEKLRNCQLIYQSVAKHYGKDSTEALHNGLDVVATLKELHRVVEAERFLNKMATTCRQLHGPDDFLTKSLASGLRGLRVRTVFVQGKLVQALRYVSSGKKCVVQDAGGKIMQVDTPVLPSFGTPVICHGLKSAPELNGKLGDVRGAGEGSAKGRYLVHLEGRTKPILVKPENLRIAFDLPEPTTSAESG